MRNKLLVIFGWVKWYLSLPQSRLRMWLVAPLAVPVVCIVRLWPGCRSFQVGTFWNLFMGHFVVDSWIQSARLKGIDQGKRRVFWLGRAPNRQWELMVRRTLEFNRFAAPIDYWNRKIPGGTRHTFSATVTHSRDVAGLVWTSGCQFPFSPEEDARGKSWLASLGMAEGEPFVTLLVRDGTFTESTAIDDLSFHDYRNSDISSYIPAIEWLADQGVWVFRMGKIMRSPIKSSHPRLVDYAFRSDRCDFLDVWLMANAHACISTGSGLDSVAHVYRRPMLMLNAMPLGQWASFTHCTWIPKDLIEVSSGRYLSIHEHLDHMYTHSHQYANAGLLVKDLSSRDILEEVQDWWEILNGIRRISSRDEESRNQFVARVRATPGVSEQHGWIHPEARVGRIWMSRRGGIPCLKEPTFPPHKKP